MARIVDCVKYGQRLPGLDQVPFPGDLGQRIYENISRAAWDEWTQLSTLLINHHGLNLGTPSHRDYLSEQMEAFFFAPQDGDPQIEGWVPPGQGGAKGGAAKGGAKGGAPGPARK